MRTSHPLALPKAGRSYPRCLKKALLAIGIAAGVVAIIIALANVVPLVVVLLAIVGLNVAWQIWERLRRMPI